MIDRLPHNIQAEQALLGAILVNNDVYAPAAVIVGLGDFFEGVHARVFDAIGQVIGKGDKADAIALMHLLANDKSLQEIDGNSYIASLVSSAVTIVDAPNYAKIIRNCAVRRQVIQEAQELAVAAADMAPGSEFEQRLGESVSELSSLLDGSASKHKSLHSMGEAGVAVIDRLATIWQQNGADPYAIATGLAPLDRTLGGGLRRCETAILAGRPGMGKSTVALQIALNVAATGKGVAFFSLEMPAISLMQRSLAAELWSPKQQLEYSRILGCKIDEGEFNAIVGASKNMSSRPLWIEDSPGLTPVEIEARARSIAAKLQRQGNSLDLVVIDHLHKCRWPGASSRVAEYSEISGRIAEIGKRLDCATLACAQLNRGVESRDDKRPTLADLRESGSIEQDADAVLFAYRDEYYLARELDRGFASIEQEADFRAALADVAGKMEVIVAKQRNGPIGTVELFADMASNVVRAPDTGLPERGAAA